MNRNVDDGRAIGEQQWLLLLFSIIVVFSFSNVEEDLGTFNELFMANFIAVAIQCKLFTKK